MVKAVLFDVGNVLINWHPENLFRKIITDDARRAYFLETVVPMDWHALHDEGVSFAENRKIPLAKHPEFTDEIIAFDERFEEMLAGPIPETMAVIEDLHARAMPLYALTNMPVEKADLVFSHIPVMPYFKDIVISGIEKIMKPDPAFYELALRRIGLPASEIFFTDDNPINIEAARALGFVVHLFDRPETLRPALVAAGALGPLAPFVRSVDMGDTCSET